MKPSEGIQGITSAWNRWIRCYKRQPSGQYSDWKVPLRMRGYIELTMCDLNKRERKAIDTALRRGYSLAKGPRWYSCLQQLLLTREWGVGYLGKTRGQLWFPNRDIRDRCAKLMEAQLVMTGVFSASEMYTQDDNYITIRVDSTWEPTKAHFTSIRIIVDEFMAEWAAQRESFANLVSQDDYVCRVPFDSFKGKNENG